MQDNLPTEHLYHKLNLNLFNKNASDFYTC